MSKPIFFITEEPEDIDEDVDIDVDDELELCSEQQLMEFLVNYRHQMRRFEIYLIEELGEEKYNAMCKDFAMKESAMCLKNLGMSDEQIADFFGKKS